MKDTDQESVEAAVFAALLESLRPAELGDERRKRMRDRVMQSISAPAPPGTSTVRSAQGEWLDVFPNVKLRVLQLDAAAGTQTLLIRAQPGGRIPRHQHSREEQFIVLEGECRLGEHRLRAGDVHVATAGSWHEPITTESGVLIWLRGEYPSPDYA
jgi:quercetin dioxygenase-like cupin family protein